MPVQIPAEALDLLHQPVLAHLATLMPDGTPQVTPIWVDFDGTYLLVNTLKGRQKALNMTKRPRIALDIADPANHWRWLAVRGQVLEITEEGADEHIDMMARKYLDEDEANEHIATVLHRPGDVRVICKIQPDLVNYQAAPRTVGTIRS